MKIIDAHHHLWDPWTNPHPWLSGEPIPFRYGDYAPLRKPFLWSEYDDVSARWDVLASVTMEGEWEPSDPLGESQWLSGLPRRPAAHAAQAWLDARNVEDVLAAHGVDPLVRSVRHKPRANPAPVGPPGGMTDAAFIEGFRALVSHDLMFELQTPWWHLHEAVRLAEHAPDVLIVLNHTGLPSDRSDDGLAGWRDAIRAFAKVPSAAVKISGLGLPGGHWDATSNRIVICETIEIFGPERCMFASNFPVDSLCASFDTIWQEFDDATQDLGEPARKRLFHGTAAAIYGITLEEGS